ncbi:hypothetical protein ANCCAN_02059 [Ancylostoma caninum]|uniref:Endonuclease/exonuclease/phosphatase domain-containing protein n=1 Tax=Ancylostoma caninum TaxID=29170 RepID=A0A368H7V7_ANCCA|nr:hypothetical protein ANCCAN_02059 [Ancylostoma caninum]
MTVCTFNARTLPSEASIEDLMMQARKIRYDVIGLTETRRHRPLNATFDTGEELFLGTCRRTLEELHIGTHGLQWNEQGERLSEFIMTINDNSQFQKPTPLRWTWESPGEKAVKFKRRSPKPIINWDLFTSLAGFWEDAVVDNIDEEYDRLVQHLRDSAKSAEGLRVTKRRLFYETLEV